MIIKRLSSRTFVPSILYYCDMLATEQIKSLVLFASGKGTNAEAMIQYFNNTRQAAVKLIVCNNPNAGVLDIATQYNIPFLLVNKKTIEELLILEQIEEYQPDLIVLAGFLWKIPNQLMDRYPNKIINVHPALLPKFGGQGMYGMNVHRAVLEAGEQESGITIHYVNEHYDEGAPILQVRCSIKTNDDAQDIARKVRKLEHAFLPKMVEFLLAEQ
jgi:phosphoribosylglycinamide formyltransferase 1